MIRQKKRKGIQIGKEELKLSLIPDDRTCLHRSFQGIYKREKKRKTQKTSFSRLQVIQINTQKSIVFTLNTRKEQMET